MVLEGVISYKLKASRHNVYMSSTTCLFPYQTMFVNYFRVMQSQYMIFKLLKDA